MAYVYRHIRVDKNEPFYIGIGSGGYRRANSTKGRNKIWYGIVARTDYEVEIVLDNFDIRSIFIFYYCHILHELSPKKITY